MSEQNKKEVEETVADNAGVEEIFAEEETTSSEDTVEVEQELTCEQQLAKAEENTRSLTAKMEEMENRYLRLQADFDNSRRRSKLDLEAAQKYRVQSLASELITSLDNFERALAVPTENEETKSMLQGLEMVYKSMMDALQKEGVEPIEAVGQEFDPNFHQAVMQVSDENFAANIVVEEFQKGYKLKDRVLRPSMVKVNQ
ncbi:nucleotide exchange factor GrpE [Bacillus massiliigorillae]|uniref:nucleotide exchange factor GrpE n=1 Tax=Bacillus massiliigorillae TaxID=1243664 RepID=UPI0003A243F7|nr:nucleotide exchange factor GrpE [Bacillus massiliigorillae]